MSKIAIRPVAMGLTLAVGLQAGCSLPLRVERIDDPTTPEQGIRYVLKRPSYKTLLRLDPSVSEVVVLPGDACVANPGSPGFTLREKPPGKTIAQLARSQAIESLEDKCFCVSNKLRLVVRQELNGPPVTYEARSHSGLSAIPHAFANSNFTVKLLDDGSLTAMSAGETDQTLEIIQTIAGLAVQAAKAAKVAPQPQCVVFDDPGMHDYVREHIGLERRVLEIARLERQLLVRQQPTDAKAVKNALESLALLRTEREAISGADKALGYVLPDDKVAMAIDGVWQEGRPKLDVQTQKWVKLDPQTGKWVPADPWFRVNLGKVP